MKMKAKPVEQSHGLARHTYEYKKQFLLQNKKYCGSPTILGQDKN